MEVKAVTEVCNKSLIIRLQKVTFCPDIAVNVMTWSFLVRNCWPKTQSYNLQFSVILGFDQISTQLMKCYVDANKRKLLF